MDLSKTGERIKELREAKKLTQSQLAAELDGYESDSGKIKISNYENGKNIPRLDNLERLASILDCDVDYLLGSIDHPDITTAWIAEQIPLSRKAIESLRQLNDFEDEYDDYHPKALTHLIDEIIINIINPYIKNSLDDPKSYFLSHDVDDIAEHIFNLVEEYYDYQLNEFGSDAINSYATEGYSFRLSLKIADIAKKAASKVGYDKAQDAKATIEALKESNPELYAEIWGQEA